MSEKGAAENQLSDFKNSNKVTKPCLMLLIKRMLIFKSSKMCALEAVEKFTKNQICLLIN